VCFGGGTVSGVVDVVVIATVDEVAGEDARSADRLDPHEASTTAAVTTESVTLIRPGVATFAQVRAVPLPILLSEAVAAVPRPRS
jgi:hypothetical protein